MEDATLVPVSTEHANRLPSTPAEQEGPQTTDTPLQQTRAGTSTSSMAYLRDRFKGQQISQEGTELLASWRPKSSKSYDSLFGKWVCWCNQRNSDPISGPVSEVVNFLADLFKQGYLY